MGVPRSGAIAAAAILSLGLGACGSSATTSSTTTSGASGSSSSAPSPTTSAPVGAGTIAIKGFAFHPNPVQAKAGDTITVTNGDGTDHSLTATDGSFDTGVFSGGSKTITAPKPGTYAFHCRIHNFMTGTLVVS